MAYYGHTCGYQNIFKEPSAYFFHLYVDLRTEGRDRMLLKQLVTANRGTWYCKSDVHNLKSTIGVLLRNVTANNQLLQPF
jgi:hypothetical protein